MADKYKDNNELKVCHKSYTDAPGIMGGLSHLTTSLIYFLSQYYLHCIIVFIPFVLLNTIGKSTYFCLCFITQWTYTNAC